MIEVLEVVALLMVKFKVAILSQPFAAPPTIVWVAVLLLEV